MHTSTFNTTTVRSDFPILTTQMRGKPLIYLDNGASTQKPLAVIECIKNFYAYQYSNVHRGVYTLSETASAAFEESRSKIQKFIHAKQPEEIVFTRGTTESINLVAQSYLRPRLNPQDEILISAVEHHANIVPWQQLCEQTGAVLKVIPMHPEGMLDVSTLDSLITHRTRLVAITHISNVLGVLTPLEVIIEKAHQYAIPVLIDGAQAAGHLRVNVTTLDCDFYAFSGHKMYGPSGIGVLYGKMKYLEQMSPWQGGGGMIRRVTFEKTEYCAPPHRFEAGTPAIAEAIGLGATIDYLQAFDWDTLIEYEANLFDYAISCLQTIPGLTLLGQKAENRMVVISFVMDKIHPHDIATVLSEEGIAVRAGHHCAMPLMEILKVPATVRVGFGIYNTHSEVDALVKALRKTAALLKR